MLLDCQDEPLEQGRADPLRLNLRQWPELLGLGDVLDLTRSARDPDFFVAEVLERLIPSYHARFEIRNSLGATLRGEDGSSRVAMLMLVRNWARNQGAQVLPRNAGARAIEPPPALSADEYLTPEAAARWESDPLSATYVNKFLDLASAHAISVFWLLPPLGPDNQARRDARGLDVFYGRVAREAQRRYPGLVVIDGRRSGYEQGVFWDEVHLDRQGAVTFSTDVAAIVADALADPGRGPWWVTLPGYRPLATAVPVEDIVESRLAVQAQQRERPR